MMLSRSKGAYRHVSMTVTKKEKSAVESEGIPRGTELGIALRSRTAETSRQIAQEISPTN